MSGGADLVRSLAQEQPGEVRRRVLAEVLDRLASFLGEASAAALDPDATFLDVGFDSLRAVDFKDELADRFGCALATTLVFDHPTPRAVAAHLIAELGLPGSERAEVAEAAGGDELDALSADELRARLRSLEARAHEPIAILGIGCRLPGRAGDPERLWQLLRGGVDAVREVPAERFSIDRYYDPDPKTPGKIATRYGAFIEDLDRFDARFFGMSAREAIELDPRQRVLLETVWQCLEQGGQSADALRGRPVGMYLGILNAEYFDSQTDRDALQLGQYHATGTALSTAAGRVSYTLGWTGPSIALDTACSSSLVALHLAVASLRRGECELAVAAGVNALIDPFSFMGISHANMLAADGRCKTFDARADGYVRSEGCGAVLLKPLSKALEDGDRIQALILGTASNQDGASGGLTVPHGPSQVAVVRAALADGRVRAAQVAYVEAHGTGTSLGDPIEVGALDEVFGATHRGRPLWVGSLKTNIGHLEPAAGIAGLIKVVLALRHGEIPPNLHFDTPSPHIPWERSVVRVPTEIVPWPRGASPRVAGVSSFGFSGTNAHAVLAEPPLDERPSSPGRRPCVLALSAASEEALAALVERYRAAFSAAGAPDLADAAYTAAVGRAHHGERLALVAESPDDLVRKLDESKRDPRACFRGSAPAQAPGVAFLFTGQGSQLQGMARELYTLEPAFRAALDRCAELLQRELDRPLLELLWEGDAALLDQTELTQPALFAVEYALAAMWRAFGVEPARLVGHSVGEYVAAAVAGVFSLADGLKLIAARGRLMKELCPPGAMLAVLAPPDAVAPFLAGYDGRVALAVENGPANTVIAGEPAAIAELRAKLARAKIAAQELAVSRAFHSPLVEPMLAAFEEVARGVEYHPPAIPIVSCVDGAIAGPRMADAAFWVRHARAPVRFQAAMEALADEGTPVMLEVGPQPVLLGMARRFLPSKLKGIPSLRRGQPDWTAIASSLAELYTLGVPLDWRAVHAGDRRRLVDLPTYPFQRELFWYERTGGSRGDGSTRRHPLLGRRRSLAVLAEGQALFESALSTESPALLAEHVAFGVPIVPGAGMVEMALSAGARVHGARELVLEGVAVREALPLGRDETAVQLVLEPRDDGGSAFRIFSRHTPAGGDAAAEEPWTLHASGTVRAVESAALGPALAEIDARASGWESIAPEDFYAAFAAAGLAYGPSFRGIRELRARPGAPGEALARVRLPDALLGSEDYRAHPALLDACFQTAAAALVGTEIQTLYLPIGMERVSSRAPLGDEVRCHVIVREGSTSERSIRLDVHVYGEGDGAAQPILAVQGLQLVRADAAALSRADEAARSLFHAIAWQPLALEDGDEHGATAAKGGGAIVIAGRGGLADALADELRARGLEARVEDPPARAETEAWTRLLGAATTLVDLSALGAKPGDEVELVARAAAAARALALRADRGAVRLALVTRGAEAAGGPVDPTPAVLCGLFSTLRVEHPELRPLCIDLDPAGSDAMAADEAAGIARELVAESGEDQIALRGRERLAPRLARMQSHGAAELVPQSDAFELRISEYGSLENLRLVPLARRSPAAGEVEVELAAAALNFKDVLFTLGLLKEWSAARGVARASDQPLGFEGAGTVVRIGAGVRGLAAGDRVAVACPGALATHVTLPAADVLALPERFALAEGAGLSTVFQTAIYALERAKLRRGERVLIHAAAGGVGQAVLQVAARAGAVVFATASPAKHELLRRQGVEHVFNSRTTDFADALLAATGGAGVDVVLNSLSGELVAASVRCLRQGGRFVEIGKLGAWAPERFARERPDAEYHFFDLSERLEEEPSLGERLRGELARGLADGTLQALPTRAFPVRRAVEAFAYLAQAKNVGKVVLTMPAGETAAARVRADRTYLVTGGLGALGMVVAERLASDGARHLVLCGRRGLEGAASGVRERVEALEAAGLCVRVAAVDVASYERTAELFDDIARTMPPLAGVVHAAGVLDDGMLLQLDAARIARVLAPKVEGARNLDRLTLGMPLDFFVMFSSMASALGSKGQAAYAAANAYLDALAHRRAAEGRAALSINWGPWSGGGMAASLASRNQVRFAEMGLRSIAPADGAALFARLLGVDRPQVLVLPIQWPKYLRQFQRGGPPALYADFAAAAEPAAAQRSTLLGELERASPSERAELLGGFIERQLARVLGFGASTRIDPRRSFGDLGVDSLLAVDLRNRLEASLEASLPATLLFDYPNVQALVGYLLERVLAGLPEATAAASAPAAAEPAASAGWSAAELESLPEDELARRLAAEIDALARE